MLTRRGFLTGGGALAAALFGATLWRVRSTSGERRMPFRDLVVETVGALELEPASGRLFLEFTRYGSEERDVDRLCEALRRQLALAPDAELDRAALLGMLTQAVKQDFADERICHVDGWYLSLTECRLAAIKHLLTASAARKEIPTPEDAQHFQRILKWGPQSTKKGECFNRQPDGSCALWFETEGRAAAGFVVLLDEHELETTISNNLITADLAADVASRVVAEVGTHKVLLRDRTTKAEIVVGEFSVLAP